MLSRKVERPSFLQSESCTVGFPYSPHLAILLALNYLSKILKDTNFCQTKISNIHILSDSQGTLTWVLKGHALKSNVFVNNRLKDIRDYLKILTENWVCKCKLADKIKNKNNSHWELGV